VKTVVVGSGLGGLAAALRLRAQGHDVTVLERHDSPGGRARVFSRDGFVFDAGPTIITAPHFIDELFSECERDRRDYVDLVPLDPFYRVCFEDGSTFERSGSEEEMVRQVEAFNPGDLEGYRRLIAAERRIFAEAMPLIDRPMGSLAGMMRLAPSLLRTRAWRSVASLVNRHVADARLRQVFSFHPLLIGGNPFTAPAIYALIPELERRFGVWFVRGGTGVLVQAMASLFREIGGDLRLGSTVEEILVDDRTRRVGGARLSNGEHVPADAVVSNADPGWTWANLVPTRFRRDAGFSELARRQYGMSLFVLYFGTDRRYSDRAHHEILMGPRYAALLDDVFRHKRLPPDFSLYLHHPTATDPSLAPPGCDTWYVLAPVPLLDGRVDWERAGDILRDRIVRYLEARYLPELSKHIVCEMRIDPRYFRDELNSPFGSAFLLEPLLTQSAWFRPHNASADVRQLYFVGAGTHPGPGIPGVLNSAKLVAAMIGPAGATDGGRPPANRSRVASDRVPAARASG
jgi:phytoene desaturase